jgi:hypothetical protein
MLYRLVTHRLPFEGDSAITLIHSQLTDPPTPPGQFRPDLPQWIDGLDTRPGESADRTLQSKTEFVILRLEDKNFRMVLASSRHAPA